MAAALCVGGPCKYALKEGSGVSMLWLREHVVPHLVASARMQDQVAIVLTKPILWACFDNSMEGKMPHGMRNRIRQAYEDLFEGLLWKLGRIL